MNVLITGAGGMVGRSLRWGIKLDHSQLDVRDASAVTRAVAQTRPDAVLHLAALDMHRCEKNPLEAVRTNALGAWHVAKASGAAGVPMVLLSSGAVFNGATGAVLDEDTTLDPVNLYGETKQLAEVLVRETSSKNLIVRTGWLFGGDQAHHRRFVERATEKAQRGEPLSGTVDEQGSPTYVEDLAAELLKLLNSQASGTVHLVNSGIASGFELAREIVRILGSSSAVEPVRGAELPGPRPRRPASEALRTKGLALRTWQAALGDYLTRTAARPTSGSTGR